MKDYHIIQLIPASQNMRLEYIDGDQLITLGVDMLALVESGKERFFLPVVICGPNIELFHFMNKDGLARDYRIVHSKC